MATLTATDAKNFTKPDEVREFPKGKAEIITTGGHPVMRATFQPGWRWTECMSELAGTKTCEATHLVYMLSGRMLVRMDDGGTCEFGPGDLSHIDPGHDAWVVGNEPCVILDFAAAPQYAKRT